MALLSSKMRSRASTTTMEHSIISFRNTSQYSAGGPSACGLASVNAVRTILTKFDGGESVRSALEQEETAMSIMAICQYWKSNEHLDVQDILSLPLFQCQLETTRFEDKQSTFNNFKTLARSLIQEGACAAVVTRAPEIVSIMSIPAEGERRSNLLVIFDSHNRPEHPLGAAFLLFYSPDDAATYLSKLFAVDASIMRDMNWQTQMLSHYSAHVMKGRPFTEEEDMQAVYDANIKLLKTSIELKEAMARESEVQAKVNEVRRNLARQKEARRQASLAEAEATVKLQNLRRELEEAREFASSLPGITATQSTAWNGHPAPIDDRRFDKPATYHVADIKSTGKAVDTGRSDSHTTSNRPQKVDHGKLQHQGTIPYGSEAEEYERVRLEHIAAKSKGKAVDTGRSNSHAASNRPQKADHGKLQHQGPVPYGSEAEEYERVRLEHVAARSAERRQELQTEKEKQQIENERIQRIAQMEDERNDFEMARRIMMEEQRAFMQQQELMNTVDKGFECMICTETWSVGMISNIDPCGHGICRDCMVGAIKAELDSRRWPILCPICRATPPESGEPGVVTRHVFENAGAESEDLDRWAQVELASVSAKMECPKCKRVSQVDQEDYNRSLMLWCPHDGCDAYWCKKCSQPAERGIKHTCDGGAEFQRWREGQKNVRDCPGCATPIQRDQGCFHMTCTNPGCNTHFCDRCGGLIVKSQVKNDIDAAMRLHYSKCKLFEYDP